MLSPSMQGLEVLRWIWTHWRRGWQQIVNSSQTYTGLPGKNFHNHTNRLMVYETGVQEVQRTHKSFDLSKIRAKMALKVVWLPKMAPNDLQKNEWRLRGRKFLGESRSTTFRANLGKCRQKLFALPNICLLIQLWTSLCCRERSSSVKRHKRCLRNSTSQNRLKSLYYSTYISRSLVNGNNIIKRFDASGHRRIVF